MKPLVSIVMSVYTETIQELEKSVESMLHQSFTDFEYIIVLDNPHNIEVKVFLEGLQEKENRIVFLKNEKNIKLGASLNKGISIAKGKYIARMDSTDTSKLTRLEKQFHFLEKNSDIDLVFTGWEQIDEENQVDVRIPSRNDFKNIKNTFFYKSPILHASMMCKREIFDTYQYPEIDRPEDFGLFIRLIVENYSFDIIEENLYTYYIDFLDIEKKYKKIKVFSSNFLRILWRNKSYFYTNVYFWWMLLICSFQWLLSRNKVIFSIFFNSLQKIYIYIFIKK